VPYFLFFVLNWIYLRHYQNLRFLYAVLTKFRTVGPFGLDWAAQQYKCALSQYITFGLLSSLQLVNLFWLFLILRILYRAIVEDVKKDERSEGEDETLDEAEDEDGAGDRLEVVEEEERRRSLADKSALDKDGSGVATGRANGVSAENRKAR
jgi:acyl-CoA-dependent ceramide synthase